MAITYTKPNPLVSLATVMDNNYSVSGNDSISALEAFKRKETMEFSDSRGKNLVPYHAVQLFSYTYGVPTSETKGDPYCQVSSGGGKEIYNGTLALTDDDDGESQFCNGYFEAITDIPDSITITIDGVTYSDVPKVDAGNGVYTYGGFTEQYPFRVTFAPQQSSLSMRGCGTHTVVIIGK